MKIRAATMVIGLIGYPVSHSLSPVMHNAAFAARGLDFCYVAFPVSAGALPEAVQGVKALGIKGVNVTVPYKESVLQFLDGVSGDAVSIGAVNTICNDRGKLSGYNTDAQGFMASLAEAGIDPKDRRVLLVGSGGAAKAVGYGLAKAGAFLNVFNRTTRRADALAAQLGSAGGAIEVVNESRMIDRTFIDAVDILINTTPLGLRDEDPLPFDVSFLRAGQVVCDLIYRDTPLLLRASSMGCRTLNGIGMLLWQGAYSFELWTGTTPPVDVMRKALASAQRAG